jgi:uncharacterized protein (TIGR02147 family)
VLGIINIFPVNQATLRLKEEYLKRRKRNPDFSLRSFAKWLRISPAQLSQILSGKRPLTQKTAAQLSERLGFSPKEKLEFLSYSSKEISSELIRSRSTKQFNMDEEQFRIISDWHHFAILSLTRLPNAKDDPRWIAKKLKITPAQANEALSRLRRLGILSVSPEFRQVIDPIRVISNAPSKAIRNHHQQNLNLAIDKLEQVPVHRREFQSVTMAVRPEKIGWLRSRLAEFINEISQELESNSPSEVYTFSAQFFPVTDIETKEPL